MKRNVAFKIKEVALTIIVSIPVVVLVTWVCYLGHELFWG